MTSGALDSPASQHPLAVLVVELGELLDRTADGPAWTLGTGELASLLPALATAKRRLDAVELRLLREADRHRVGDPVGAANTAGWWANTTRITKPVAHRAVALAERLDDSEHTATAAALSAGVVSVDQAAVILDAVEALPPTLVDVFTRRQAESHLVGLATHHDPKELRILGRRILEVVAPEIAEAHEQKVLEDQEHHAAATASFVMRSDGHGSMHGRFKIPVLAGEILAKHLAAIAAPKHRAATGSHDNPDPDSPENPENPERRSERRSERVSRPLRLGQAFVEYLQTRAASGIPQAGGLPATVVVTMTMTDLLGETNKAALLDTGAAISAAEARRLACEAGIIPAVLGSRSQPLDLGRERRFHTKHQRIALMLTHRGCAAAGCDWPPGLCHAHHGTPWSHGGHTNIKDGLLLCPRHHTLAHDTRYQLTTNKHGKVTFTRRT